MKKMLFLGLVLGVLMGCKSKLKKESGTPLAPKTPSAVTSTDNGLKSAFFSHLDSNEFKFQSFNAKGSIHFTRNGDSHTADITIRIKNHEIIWFYVNLSIIPVAQGYITPTDIKIKNLLSGEYIHKPISYLQELSGIPISFNDLQSILVGNKLNAFLDDSTRLKISGLGEFLLEGSQNNIQRRFSYNPQYRPMVIDLMDSLHKRNVNLKYSNFLAQNGTFIPQSIQILAKADDNNLEIQMDYRRIQLNPDQDYPFHSPDDSN